MSLRATLFAAMVVPAFRHAQGGSDSIRLVASPTLQLAQVDTAHRRARRELAKKDQPVAYEALMALRSGRISRALQSPESLLVFIAQPRSFYLERRAAAMQSKGLIPMSWVPRLWEMIAELQRNGTDWGLAPHPLYGMGGLYYDWSDTTQFAPRMILGHKWTPLRKPTDYPLTPSERERAPWPWQVQQALRDALSGLVPGSDRSKAEAYLAAVMTMPCGTDEEAQLFVQASWYSYQIKTSEIMGALRNIALNPRHTLASVHVTNDFASSMQRWDDSAAWGIGNAGMMDILRDSPNVSARDNSAYGLKYLGEALRDGRTVKRKIPAALLLEAGRRAMDPATGSEWNRLYAYVFSIAEAYGGAVKSERGMDPQSPLVAQRLSEFRRWFDAERPRLELLAAEQAIEVDAARRLIDTPKCRASAGGDSGR